MSNSIAVPMAAQRGTRRRSWLANKWLVRGAQALCVLAIAYAAANSAQFFLAGPVDIAPVGLAANTVVAAGLGDEVSIEKLRAMHLFGRPPAPTYEPTENLQETKLSLALVGVFVDSGDDGAAPESRALIARKGAPAEAYAIGDRLPGNAKLIAVRQDRVVITRGGVRELIRFDTNDVFHPNTAADTADEPDGEPDQPKIGKAPSAAGAETAKRQSSRAGDAEQLLEAHWDAIESDPAKLLRDLGVGVDAQSAQDAGQGYALGELATRPELSHTGLQPGDRLLSVNGHAVGDPAADRDRMRQLAAQGSLRLEVQRGERRMFITLTL